MSRNDLDLQYSHIVINLVSFRPQAAIVSEKSTFSYKKGQLTKFDIAEKYVKVTPGFNII